MLLVLGMAVVPGVRAQTASEQFNVLEKLEARITAEGSEITIRFAVPVSYVGHHPQRQGKYLVVRIDPVGRLRNSIASPGEANDYSRTEVLSWTATDELPLQEVEYEGSNPSGPIIELTFTRKVAYKVVPGKDMRSLTVIVARGNQGSNKTGAVPGAKRHAYLIELKTSDKPFKADPAVLKTYPPAYRFFTARERSGAGTLYHWRVGFFYSAAEIGRALKRLRPRYPQARVRVAGARDLQLARRDRQDRPLLLQLPPQKPRVTTREGGRKHGGTGAVAMMRSARTAMLRGDYGVAIGLYSRVIRRYPDSVSARQAQEYLGMARQRNRQIAHAVREYRTYLKKYPDTEGAVRVRQRLNGLLTASAEPRRRLPGTTIEKKAVSPWRLYGNVYTTIRTDRSRVKSKSSGTTTESKSTFFVTSLNTSARKRTDKSESRVYFSGLYRSALDDLPGRKNSDGRVNYFYMDYRDKRHGWGLRVGRQNRSTGGVLGRFDGLAFDYRLSARFKLNFVTGYPVDFGRFNQIQTNKYFYGLSTDISTANKYLSYNLFLINQTVDGISDRESVGGEIRYMHPKHSLFALVDYDYSYAELNTFFVINSWRFANKATLNLAYDYRRSPVLTTSNALHGQAVSSIEELMNLLSEEQIRQLAKDRTAEYTSFSIAGSYPLNSHWTLNGDIVVSKLEGTPTTFVPVMVVGTPGSDREYYYTLQLIRNSLFKDGDISIFGLRYSDATNFDKQSYSYSLRYPLTNRIRLRPRLVYELAQMNDGSDISIYRGSLRVDYRPLSRLRVEFETGYTLSEVRHSLNDRDQVDYYASLGFILDF